MRRISLLVAVVLVCGGGGETPAGEPSGSGLTESVDVRRVVFPLQVKARRGADDPERCATLAPADLILEEDGRPVSITAVEKRPEAVTHALLLDVSSSMRKNDRLAHAKKAAIRYVRSLPDDEQVLVAAFDDSLVLAAPPGLDREATVEAIDGIELGNWTALWDALYELSHYLESLQGQKIVVALTDGEDSTSMVELTSEPVIRMIASIPDLSIFPVGVELVPSGLFRGSEVRGDLQNLAWETGGLYFEIRGAGNFDEVFDRIRTHLTRRTYAIYVPTAFGEGANDDLGEGYRDRKIKVRMAKGIPCRVVAARHSRRSEAAPAPPVAQSAAAVEAPLPACIEATGPYRVAEELRGETPVSWPGLIEDPPALWVLDPPGVLAGRTPDVMRERGVLYHHRSYASRGKLRTSIDRKPQIESRDFAIEVPPLDSLLGCNSPEDVLLRMLRDSVTHVDRGGHRHERELNLVHGKTFLEMRPLIGTALFEHYPAYRDWAQRRLEQQAAPEVERILDQLGDSVDEHEREEIRAQLLAAAIEPTDGSAQQVLAEWLGDVPARKLVLDLEKRLAGLMLEVGDSEARAIAERFDRKGWPELHAWFPPATEVRVLSPLVPAYDAERDVIGFYRVVLPRPGHEDESRELPPAEPFGLRTVRYLVDALTEPEAFGGVRVTDVRHPRLPRTLKRKLRRGLALEGALQQAQVELAGERDGRLTVAGVFRQGDSDPVGLSACVSGEDPALSALAARIGSLPGYLQLPCD